MAFLSNFTKALESVLYGTNNVCCLCLNIGTADDLICTRNESSITRNGIEENIAISDLILTVLGSDVTPYIEALENICKLCAKSLFNCYTFVQTSNTNITLLSNALEMLNNGFQIMTKPQNELALYVTLNLNDLSPDKHLCDNQNITSAALKESKKQIKIIEPISKPKKHGKKDLEMLKDPHNHDSFQCKECLKIYPSIVSLRSHYTKEHADKVYQCSKCVCTYTSKALLHSHILENHRKVTCEECGKICNSLQSFKKHKDGHTMSLVCPDCGRTYKNPVTYKNHIQLDICNQERRHNPLEAKYTCDYCNKKYTQKMSLRVHIQFEHGNYKAHICEWCGKKFWAQSRLKAHIVKHTRERNFTCDICDGKFVTKESLLYHTRLHTGEKPYKCPECSSCFLSASRRSDHVKKYHTGADPGLECNICQGKFRSADVLLKHRKTHEKRDTPRMYTSSQKIHNLSQSVVRPVDNEKPLADELEILYKLDDSSLPMFPLMLDST